MGVEGPATGWGGGTVVGTGFGAMMGSAGRGGGSFLNRCAEDGGGEEGGAGSEGDSLHCFSRRDCSNNSVLECQRCEIYRKCRCDVLSKWQRLSISDFLPHCNTVHSERLASSLHIYSTHSCTCSSPAYL